MNEFLEGGYFDEPMREVEQENLAGERERETINNENND